MSIKSFENLKLDPLYRPSWFFEGYSDYWRRNKSMLEPVEMANVLRALRKIVGHIGQNIGSVEWEGMKKDKFSGSEIKIDPNFVMGDYPVPPGKMDVLVGVVVHESLHQREWSDFVWQKLDEATKDVNFRDKDILWRMFDAGEDIYVDLLASKTTFGFYVKRLREVFSLEKSMISSARTPGKLFELWKYYVLDNKKDIPQEYQYPLEVLLKGTENLVKTSEQSKSVSERCSLRAMLYKDLWDQIKDHICKWKRDEIIYFGIRREKQEKKKAKDTPDQQPMMPLSLSSQIEQSLAAGSSDLTPFIKAICGYDDPSVLPTSLWEFNIKATPAIDPYLVARLKNVFQTYANRVLLINRGLESGNVDRKRLYRAATTGRCFMSKQLIAELAWDITLVVDCSKSMEGAKGKIVENTIAALVKALEGQQNRIKVFGYFEHDGVCIVAPLLRQGKLYTVPPHGRTPSGQAIIAAVLQTPKERKRRFVIHITDGESNCGCSVEKALDFCKREKVDIITLGCAYRKKEILMEQYGNSLQLLDYIEQLPKALEVLFRRKLLYGT